MKWFFPEVLERRQRHVIAALRIAVFVSLAPMLCQASVPYVHRHDQLSSAALAEHLNACHRNCSQQDLPHDWHVHFLQLEAVGEAKSVPIVVAAAHEFDGELAPSPAGSFSMTTVIDPVGNSFRAAARDLALFAPAQRDVLTHFCVRLI